MPHTKPISIKTNIEDYVKCRLLDWANWFKTDQYGNNHLKHKKENIIYRLMYHGFGLNEPLGFKPLPVNREAEEIEQIMRIYAKAKQQRVDAIRALYFGKGDYTQRAKSIAMGESLFRKEIKLAHEWLDGWFTAKLYTHLLLTKEGQKLITDELNTLIK